MRSLKNILFLIAATMMVAAIVVCIRFYYTSQQTWTFAFYLNGNNNLLLEQQKNLHELIKGNEVLKHGRVAVYLDRGEGGGVPLMYSWKGPRLFHINGNYINTLSNPIAPGLPPSIEISRFKKIILQKLGQSDRQLFQTYYIPDKKRYRLNKDILPNDDRAVMLRALHGMGYLPKTDTTQADSLSAEAMDRFFSFVRDNFESRHYAFFIAGHGQGWFSDMIRKDRSGILAILRAPNFNVQNIKKALEYNRPDVLSLDLCLMGDLESVYELKQSTTYLIVSQGPLPARGQNYRDLLEKIYEQKPADTEGMARTIFSSCAGSLKKSRLHGAVALVKNGPAIESFRNNLINTLCDSEVQELILSHENRLIRLPAWGPMTSEMIDLDSLAIIINDYLKKEILATESFILDRFSTSPRAGGLSIYYPLNKSNFMSLREYYSALSFNRDFQTGWLGHLDWTFNHKNNHQ